MQKRVVILGGAGFIGSHLCLRLLEAGHEVYCVDIRDADASPLLRNARQHPAFRFVRHNIINPFGIRCDEIYNMASPSRVRYDKALPVETLKVSMLGSIHALETARAEHARILFGSSGNLCDNERTCCIGSNGDTAGHRMLGEGKTAAEALHRAYRTEYDVDARIARIFNTYGPGADLLDHQCARTDEALRSVADLSTARRELNWTPHTPLVEGLRRTISYVEKELATKNHVRMTWAEMN